MADERPGLRHWPRRSDFVVGAAVKPEHIEHNAQLIAEEFSSITPEHHQKWWPLCDKRLEAYDFAAADAVVDFALSNNAKARGHCLVWHVTTPHTAFELSNEELREATRRHIYTTVAHFNGRCSSWDVVNEALAPDGSMAATRFNDLGVEFLADCFKWANAADPNAVLVYNDNKVENAHSKKCQAMLDLLDELKNVHGAPIHQVGLQAHFDASGPKGSLQEVPLPSSIVKTAELVHSRLNGATTHVSEMDVRVSRLSAGDEDTRIDAQCEIYGRTLAALSECPHVDGVTFWGVDDETSWVHDFYYEDAPLLFDKQGRKRPWFDAAKALKGEEFSFSDWRVPEWSGEWTSHRRAKEDVRYKRMKANDSRADFEV